MSSGKEVSAGEVQQRLALAVERAGSKKAFAREQGLSPQYVGHVIRGREEAGPRILASLGLRRETRILEA